MSKNFEKNARAEKYVSPTLDAAFLKVEKGFCGSGTGTHDGFDTGDDLNFEWN